MLFIITAIVANLKQKGKHPIVGHEFSAIMDDDS